MAHIPIVLLVVIGLIPVVIGLLALVELGAVRRPDRRRAPPRR